MLCYVMLCYRISGRSQKYPSYSYPSAYLDFPGFLPPSVPGSRHLSKPRGNYSRNRKCIGGIRRVELMGAPEDLAVALPFGMVDCVGPILHLEGYCSMVGCSDDSGASAAAAAGIGGVGCLDLGLFEGDGAWDGYEGLIVSRISGR